MEQLLKVTTIPIKYELKITDARLVRQSGTAELEMTRNKGGLQIKSRPIRLRMDTYDARNSVVPTTKAAIYQAADRGLQAAYDATAQFAEAGQILLNAKIGEGAQALQDIWNQRYALPTGEFQMGFLPATGPNIEWDAPSLSINYEMDKLYFEPQIYKGDVQFIPGDIELSILQYPSVHIEYVGSPIYVPPSAAEKFTGENVDVRA